MSYTYNYDKMTADCIEEIQARKARAERDADARIKALAADYPEYAEIDRELRSTADKLVAAIRYGKDVSAAVEQIKSDNLSAQSRRLEFLKKNGFGEDYILPRYTCRICGDTGFVSGSRCDCLKSLISAKACAILNQSSPMSLCDFDSFSLDYYEGHERDHMSNVLEFVADYARSFAPGSPNLLFYGNTGLGKTHLSLAVASVVLSKGFTAVYEQAQTLFDKIADERFSRDSRSDYEDSILGCDLLIIDDLGAELVNQMTQSVLFSIINTRLLKRKSMIISTNIPLDDLDRTYHERISSRLCFEFEPVPFVGNDVRQKRRRF